MILYVPAYIAPKHVDFMKIICQQEILTRRLFLPLRFRGEKKNLTTEPQNSLHSRQAGTESFSPDGSLVTPFSS